MIESFTLRKLLARTGLARLFPSVRRSLAGSKDYLRYYSDRTLAVQLVSTALRTSKKSRTMLWAQALASGDGLPNATCATFGIATTVAFVSVRATRGPNDGAVCA